MKPWFLSILGLALPGLVHACDGHNHARRSAFNGPPPGVQLTKPMRPLVWGDINILHTTDIHGWFLGHRKTSFPEPNYSADFGDFASFVLHMNDTANKMGKDLLLVDSGDLHDGTGLVDGYPAGGVDGQAATQIMKQLPYDIMTIGNHELYNYTVTLDTYLNFAPVLNGRYLTSNVDIIIPLGGKNVSQSVGARLRRFQTPHGRTVTAFGILFNFTGNAPNTTVQGTRDLVNEDWFKGNISEPTDLFLLAGHMPVSPTFEGKKVKEYSWDVILNAIRHVPGHETTPILILGGHTHVRDCARPDDQSIALESGRYMDTVGWLSANISTQPVGFSRRYLDTNRLTYEYHTDTDESNFNTPLGQTISDQLEELSKQYNLTAQFGTAPQDYLLNGAPYTSRHSLYSLFVNDVLPVALKTNTTRTSQPAMYVVNANLLRFDLYAGPFTTDDQFTISIYNESFHYIPDISLKNIQATVEALNNPAVCNTSAPRIERREDENLTLGYVTHDNCSRDEDDKGDDTLHLPLQDYHVPQHIVSDPPSDASPETPLDLVFNDHIMNRTLTALNCVQHVKNYTQDDVQLYSDILADAVLGVYAHEKWNSTTLPHN